MPNINLNYKMVTDIKNNFFTNNRFIAAESLPAEGDFVKGDLIVNIGENANDEAMWLCVESGNPGVWEVVGAGAGGGSSKIVTLKSRVVVNEALSEVNIGVSGFNKATDTLIAFNNARFMVEGVDYEINDDSTKIVAMNGNIWNEELANDYVFDFVVFKMMNVNENGEVVVSSANEIVKLKNTVVVNEAVNEVEIGIDGFNEGDDLTVYRNSVYMIEGIDYEIQGSKIVSLKGAWNVEGGSDYKFTFEVLKTVAKINPDAVVGMEHLKDDVKEAIEAAGNIDLSGYATKEELNNLSTTQIKTTSEVVLQDSLDETWSWLEDVENLAYENKAKIGESDLQTTDKTIVGAINELFQSANNGKELIANAIGEPLSSEDTFSAMSTDINGLLSTFKTNMMNNGITVESTDKFKSLIDKIATMVEEGSGKSIQYASGICTQSSYSSGEYDSGTTYTFNIQTNLTFVPDIIFVRMGYNNVGSTSDISNKSNLYISNLMEFNEDYTGYSDINKISIDNITKEGFQINVTTSRDSMGLFNDWYAIGVGEEDTTFRDSLASILTEEGVSVTEEDDMASLITKVDEEFDNQVVPAGDAVADNVLSGKTFINSTGQTITGTMANRGGAQTVTPGTSNKTLNAGYYSGNITVQGDSNLIAENIVSGKSIFGVSGTAPASVYYSSYFDLQTITCTTSWKSKYIYFSDSHDGLTLPSKPSKLIVYFSPFGMVDSSLHNKSTSYAHLTISAYSGNVAYVYISEVTDEYFRIYYKGSNGSSNIEDTVIYWYAFY